MLASPVRFATLLRRWLLLGSALGPLLTRTAPAAAQTYVGNDFPRGLACSQPWRRMGTRTTSRPL